MESAHNQHKESIEELKIINNKLERELSEKNKMLNMLEEAQRIGEIGCWEWDIQKQKLIFSPEMFRILNLDRNKFQGHFEDLFPDTILAEDREKLKKIIYMALSDGKTSKVEYRIVHRNKTIHTLEATTKIEYNSEEMAIRLYGIIQNITERKIIEEELNKTKEQIKLIINTVPHIILARDSDGNFLFANQAIANAYNLTTDKLRGKNIRDVHKNHEELHSYLIDDREVIDTWNEKFIVEETFQNHTGNVQYLQTHKIPFEYFGRKAVLIVSVDITDRKNMEKELDKHKQDLEKLVEERSEEIVRINKELINFNKELTRSERTYKQLNQKFLFHFQKTPLAYIELTPEFTIIDWNPAAEKIFGYTDYEAINQNVFELLVPDEIKPQLNDELLQLILKEGDIMSTTYNKTKDGRLIYCDWYNTSLYDQYSKNIGVACLVHDVTKRKMAERTIKKANKELKKAKEEAETANKTKSEFLANMSHEIRTPMNSILGFTELLNELLEEEKQKQYLSSIQSSGRVLLNLINDILDLSKIEAGRFQIQYSSVNLYSLIWEIQNFFSITIEQKNLDFIIEIEQNLANFYLDELRIKQILINLIGNAIKFTESGFIKISLKTHKENNRSGIVELFISVQDSGIGIPMEEQQMIFDAFSQRAGQDHAKYGGTGLGLTICNRLVKMMNGEILLESEIGKGSIFTIHFKSIQLAPSSYAPEKGKIYENEIKFQEATILIIDDIKDNRDLIKAFLEKEPFHLLEASNGREGLDILQNSIPNLILLDIRMPIMDGYEFIKILHKNSKWNSVPVIALTASSVFNDPQKELFNSYIRKPIRKAILYSEIKKYLSYFNTSAKEKSDTPSLVKKNIDTINIKKLLNILELEHKPKIEQLIDTLIFDEIESFAKSIMELAEKFEYDFLKNYGKRLFQEAESFDIVKIPSTMEEFYKILYEMKNHLK